MNPMAFFLDAGWLNCLRAPVWSLSRVLKWKLGVAAVWLPRLPPSLPCYLPFFPVNVTTSLRSLFFFPHICMCGCRVRMPPSHLCKGRHTALPSCLCSLSKMGANCVSDSLLIFHADSVTGSILTSNLTNPISERTKCSKKKQSWSPFLDVVNPLCPLSSFWMHH